MAAKQLNNGGHRPLMHYRRPGREHLRTRPGTEKRKTFIYKRR